MSDPVKSNANIANTIDRLRLFLSMSDTISLYSAGSKPPVTISFLNFSIIVFTLIIVDI